MGNIYIYITKNQILSEVFFTNLKFSREALEYLTRFALSPYKKEDIN